MRNLTQQQLRHNYEVDRSRWAREAKTRKQTGETQPWGEAEMELNACFLYKKLLHLEGPEVPIQILRDSAGMNREREEQRMKQVVKEQAADSQRVIERVEKRRQLAEAKEHKDETEKQQDRAGAQQRKQTEPWRFLEQLLEQQRAAGVPQRAKMQRADEDTALSEIDIRRKEKCIGRFSEPYRPINAQDEDGNTALHIAARRLEFYNAEQLIAAGASRRIINNRGQTASDLATGYQDLSDFLKE